MTSTLRISKTVSCQNVGFSHDLYLRFELTRQRKAHEFQKRLLIEYETEVQRLHDRNQALEAALRDAEKKKVSYLCQTTGSRFDYSYHLQ